MLSRVFPKQFDNTYRGYWLEQIGRRVFLFIDPLPIAPSGDGPSMGFIINLAFTASLLIGFALSIGPADKK